MTALTLVTPVRRQWLWFLRLGLDSAPGTASSAAADADRFVLGGDTDPLVGAPHPGSTKLTVPGTSPYFVAARPRLVTMRGGGYLFQPSMTALRHLAGLA